MVKTQKRNSMAGGAYTCEQKGKGTFGIVSVCEDPSKTPFAVKLINATANRPKAYDLAIFQLNNEIALLSRLKHRNIVAMAEVNPGDLPESIARVPGPKLYLEYCEGGTLAEYMKKIRSDPANMVNMYDIAKQIFAGLHYLYSNNIVHMDLKPVNVLVKQGVMKIADFGMAIDAEKYMHTLCGTPTYVPTPDQCKLGGFYRDIYAYMCTVFFCVFNKSYNIVAQGKTLKQSVKMTLLNALPIKPHMFKESQEYAYFNDLADILFRFTKFYKITTTQKTEANSNRATKKIRLDTSVIEEPDVNYEWLYNSINTFFDYYKGMDGNLPIGETLTVERRRSLTQVVKNVKEPSFAVKTLSVHTTPKKTATLTKTLTATPTKTLTMPRTPTPTKTPQSTGTKKSPFRSPLSIKSPFMNQLPQLRRGHNHMLPPPLLRFPNSERKSKTHHT